MHLFEEIFTFVSMVVRFPLRIICKSKNDHNWYHYGGGFIFTNKYKFICKRCGCRSTGSMDDLKKKGFKGTARIR